MKAGTQDGAILVNGLRDSRKISALSLVLKQFQFPHTNAGFRIIALQGEPIDIHEPTSARLSCL